MEELIHDEAEISEETDAVVLALGAWLKAWDAKAAIINPRKIAQMKRCFELIQSQLAAQDVSLSYHLHDPYKSTGSIVLEADKFIFDHPELLRDACALASNAELYPLVNGKLRIAFAFDGLTVPIE